MPASNSRPLAGKAAIVTGAGSGIGRAIAQSLSGAGAAVALLGRRRELLDETRGLLDASARALVVPLDVADRPTVDESIARVAAELGAIDIVVNNAGTNTPRRSLADIDPADWDAVIEVNLTGAYNVTRASLEALRRSGDGLVINVGSTAAVYASRIPGIAYTASKHAITGFTAALRQEERAHGIRATALHPGEVDTPILEKRPEPVSAERRRVILRPEDVAAAVLFIALLPGRACVPEMVIEPTA
jgi:NAD(P)-dependent dehydrogenase (short-subunit alcohol dehydrogenase family)